MAQVQRADQQQPGQPDGRLEAIAARLAEILGEPLTGAPHQLSSGASRETYRVRSASHGDVVAQLDRRRERIGGERPAQAPLLQAASAAGVPVARVIAHGGADPVLGESWLLVEALPGTADPRQILAAEGLAQAGALIDSIAAALAAVHRMPADPRLAPPVEDPIGLLRSQYQRLGEPHPTFELAFQVLGDAPQPARRTFVHGDFRMGNLLVGEAGVTAVLDWELAHLGDPIEDLGWLCVPAWRFMRREHPAAGLASREALIEAYERHAHVEIDPAALRWWELAGTLRWGVICVMQAAAHLSGEAPSVELAVIGRRACEVEWDLLEMLDAGGRHGGRAGSASTPPGAGQRGSRPEAGAGLRASLHDRPSAVELIEAARGSLGGEVLPLLDGRASFELRVALRALGMVARELRHRDEHAALRRAALARLGAADEAELATAVRTGAFNERRDELLETLGELVRAKLEVANPRYIRELDDAPPKEGS